MTRPGRRGRAGALLLALTLLLFPLAGRASAWEGWQAFQEASRKITAIEARFVQNKTLAILARPLVSSGRFCYQAPASLRWEYEKPVATVLLMKEGTLKRYLKEKGEWRVDASAALPAMQTILAEIAQWQQGRFEGNPHFRAEMLEGAEPRVILVPKEESWRKVIRRIELTPDRERPGVIRSVRMTEDERAFTLLEFTQVNLDGRLPVSLFEKPE